MKEIVVLNGKLYVREKANNVIVKDGALYAQDFSHDPEDWITMNGSHVEIGEGGKIVGGAGGKLNGSVYKGTQKRSDEAVKGIGRPQDSDKNHPYWKTPEGKAEQYFSQRMAAAEHGTFTHQEKNQKHCRGGEKKSIIS